MRELNDKQKELLAKVLSLALDKVEPNEIDSLIAIGVKNKVELDNVFLADADWAKKELTY